MKIPKSFGLILALLYVCALPVACTGGPTGSGAGTLENEPLLEAPLAGPDARLTYDIEGLVVTPVLVGEGADRLDDGELLAIFDTLSAQAYRAANLSLFEFDADDNYEYYDGTLYCAITNFRDREDVFRNCEAVFSYAYFQSNVRPVLYQKPYPSSGEAPLLLDVVEGKMFLNCASTGSIPLSGPIESDFEVIDREPERFFVKMRQEFLAQNGTVFQPYVVTVIEQEGLWVLDNFYWFDVMLHW